MPDGIDWVRAWVRLEKAVQRKLDALERQSDNGDYRSIREEMTALEDMQELMAKYEPKDHKRKRLGVS
jgi:hypothetical protein